MFSHANKLGLVMIDLHFLTPKEATQLFTHLMQYQERSLARSDAPWKLHLGVGAGKHSDKEV